MTKRKKLERFIVNNRIDERDAKRLHWLLSGVIWKRSYDFYLGQKINHGHSVGEYVSTAIDETANDYHVCWLSFPRCTI